MPVAVLAVAALLVLGPWREAPVPSTPASLPLQVAPYSYLTGPVSLSPPGPAVALWQQGFGVEFMDVPQALVLSAHGDTYRRVDVAERRGGAESQGDPAPMLLSPDGRQVAVGRHAATAADIALLDLSTGDVERHRVPGAASVRPVAWSFDGRWVAYLAGARPTNPYSGTELVGRPGVLDLQTGEARSWARSVEATALAFSPDGSELAAQTRGGPGTGLQVFSRDGTSVRTLADGASGRLAGPAAWSPDGELLAVAQPGGGLSFADVTGRGDVPDPLGADAGLGEEVLGWTSDREAVVARAYQEAGTGPGDHQVRLVDLGSGEQRVLTTVPTQANYGVARFQLASALLPGLELRAPGEPDRGVPPVPVLLLATLALALSGWLLVGTWRRVARPRGRTAVAGPVVRPVPDLSL